MFCSHTAGRPEARGLKVAQAPGVSLTPAPEPEALRVDSGAAASSSGGGGGGGSGGDGSEQQQGGASPLRIAWRRVLRELSSLPRAIGLMALIAALSGLGTIVPQNKASRGTGATQPLLARCRAANCLCKTNPNHTKPPPPPRSPWTTTWTPTRTAPARC